MNQNNPDQPDAEAVLGRLSEAYGELPPQLRRSARYILDHPHEVGVRTMRALAGQAEVHPNSLIRLAKQLGFEGYEPMRERFRNLARGGAGGFSARALWLQALAREGGTAAVMGQMAGSCLGNIEQMFQNQSAGDLDAAADILLAARRVYVVGVGAAYPLAHTFWYVARMAFDHLIPVPHHGSLPVDDLSRVSASDAVLAMTFQPYRSETLRAVRLAQAHGAKVLGITDSRASPLARSATIAFITPTQTPQFFQSSTPAMALLEALLALMVARGGDDAAERIDAFHRERWAAGAYEEDPPQAPRNAADGSA